MLNLLCKLAADKLIWSHTSTTITNITNFQLNHLYIKEATLTLFARLYVTKYSDFCDAVKNVQH